MSEVAIGLPNTGLRPIVSTFTSNVRPVIPFEKHAERTGVGAEANVFPGGAITDVFTISSNKKVSIEDILVNSSMNDTIWRVYRNGVQVLQFDVEDADKTERIPLVGGMELDEGETLRVTASSVTGNANVVLDIRGREELKRNELFSQILA
jgi:hypothetical protein